MRKNFVRENYILLKDLPDAAAGTVLIWDESANAYYYEKNCWVSPHQRNYLTAGQVTQTPEWFEKMPEQDSPSVMETRLSLLKEMWSCKIKVKEPTENIELRYIASDGNEITNYDVAREYQTRLNIERETGQRMDNRNWFRKFFNPDPR